MKPKLLIPIVLLFGATGCRVLTDSGAAAGGAALAHHLTDGNPAWTAAGAAGGVVVAEGAQALAARAKQKAYQAGLDQGRAEAVKQTYWMLQHAHQPAAATSRSTLYPIRFPEQEVDGVIYQPTTRYLRIHQ